MARLASGTTGAAANAFTRAFGVEVPVIGAAMSGASTSELAGAVARAGGLGFLGAGRLDANQIQQDYSKAMQLAQSPTAAVGIGLLSFLPNSERVQAIIDCRPKAAWLAAGSLQPHCQQLIDAGIPVIVQTNTLEEIEEAVLCGASAVIAQGSEAGGHGWRYASTLSFVPEAVDLVQRLCDSKGTPPVPVLAAGGISDPRQAAAAMVLGAQGVVLGTRLLATPECCWPESQKQVLVHAGSQAQRRPATTCTAVFDDLDAPEMQLKFQGRWPEGCVARAIQTPFTEEWGDKQLQKGDVERLGKQIAAAKKAGDMSVVPVWSGSSVGLIKSIMPAGEVVRMFGEAIAGH